MIEQKNLFLSLHWRKKYIYNQKLEKNAYLRKGEPVHRMTNSSFTVFHCRGLFGCTKDYCLAIFNSYTTLKKTRQGKPKHHIKLFRKKAIWRKQTNTQHTTTNGTHTKTHTLVFSSICLSYKELQNLQIISQGV